MYLSYLGINDYSIKRKVTAVHFSEEPILSDWVKSQAFECSILNYRFKETNCKGFTVEILTNCCLTNFSKIVGPTKYRNSTSNPDDSKPRSNFD